MLACRRERVHAATEGVADSGETKLEEIVVTANKRAENMQNVPISIDVVRADELAAAGVNNTLDLVDKSLDCNSAPARTASMSTCAASVFRRFHRAMKTRYRPMLTASTSRT